MKEIEELLNKFCWINTIQSISAWEANKQKILSRFSDLSEKVKALEGNKYGLETALQNQMQCVVELKEFLHNCQQQNASLKKQVEDLKNESRLLENILNYVWSVPIRQRCAIWKDINQVCSNWQSDNMKKEDRG